MSQENFSSACEASSVVPLPTRRPLEPPQILNGGFHATFLVQMPSPAANIPSRHSVKIIVIIMKIAKANGWHFDADFAVKWQSAPAKRPKGCPCAKTLCVVEDCHKTWHCSVIRTLPSHLSLSFRFDALQVTFSSQCVLAIIVPTA
eukprot:56526-Amphidinium_carterae.1